MIELKKLPAMTAAAAAKLRPMSRATEWALIVDDVESGRAELFRAGRDTYVVTRAETTTRELVICCLAGEGARDLFAAGVAIARRNGMRSIRFHTQRKGLARLLGEFGPVETETVYTVQV